MASFWRDFRYAIRVYSNHKTFTLIAVLTLALGVGANTGLFTVINAVLLRPLPYPQPERIVQVYRRTTWGKSRILGYPWFRMAERSNHSFEYLAAWYAGPRFNVAEGDSAQMVQSTRVTSDFFRVFGVHPVVGRDFTREDDLPGAAPVMMISHPLWKSFYGGDPNILGRAIRVKGESVTVIGVMRPGFTAGPDCDAWIPLRKAEDWTEHTVGYLVAGRLRSHATMEGARQDLDLLWAQLRKEKPDAVDSSELGAQVTTYLEQIVGGYRTPLLLLAGAAAAILLIACVNVANLLLVRAMGRRQEIAIRIALGTSRSRLIRQLLTESLLLAAVSGACGLALAGGVLHALKPWLTEQLIRGHEISMDFRILWFGILAIVLTGIAFGLAPAVQLTQVNPVLALRDFGGSAGGRRARRFRSGLISAQIGLSAAILLAAGLLLASFRKLQSDDLGFMPQGVLTFEASMTDSKFQTTASSSVSGQQLIERLAAIPGVRGVAAANALPTAFAGGIDVTLLPDPVQRNSTNEVAGESRQITPGYFEVMRIPIHSGRAFTESDTGTSTPVAIVNESFVRKYLSGANPIGLHMVLGQGMGPEYADRPREIVGVAADTRGEHRMQDAAVETIYVPMAQIPDRTMAHHNSNWPWSWVIRTSGSPQALSLQIVQEMRKAEPSLVIGNPRPLVEIVGAGIEPQKMQTALIASFAIMALLLAAVGLYGTMSQTVAERRHELGIRSALGATGRDLLWLMMNYSFKLIVAGLVAGVALFLALQRFIAAYLFGVHFTDPAIHMIVLALLAFTALSAALVPAMRARNVDPTVLLH